MNKIYCLGIGYRPFHKKARDAILSSDVIIIPSNRLFEIFSRYDEYVMVKDKIKVINNVYESINFIKSKIIGTDNKKIVLIASGDPMFFGIGRKIVKEFGKDIVEIYPDLSIVQLAFSRIKETWDDAFLISLHGSGSYENKNKRLYEIDDIPLLIQQHNKIAILTDKENNPSRIANVVLNFEKRNNVKIFVCERIDYPDERIVEGTPEEIAKMSFADPNLVIIKRLDENKGLDIKLPIFGLTEDEFAHSRGLITKDEVRAATIHKLRPPKEGVFWDIGAGSGSVSIEIAQLCPGLKVFAIEKDEEQINHIKENIVKFNVTNIYVIKGTAPEILNTIPSPDRVFIGGSDGRLKEIINFIAKTKAKIVVINAATIETLNEAIQSLESNGFKVDVSQISVSRSKIIANKRYMHALNPIFIIRGIIESNLQDES